MKTYLFTDDLPCTPSVAELITKRWDATTVDEYMAALGAVLDPIFGTMVIPWVFPNLFNGKTTKVHIWKRTIGLSDLREGGVLQAVADNGPSDHLFFTPIQVLPQVCARPDQSIVAERNLFDELVASLPAGPVARGEFLFALSPGVWSQRHTVTSPMAAFSRRSQQPMFQSYFQQGWWRMGMTNGKEVKSVEAAGLRPMFDVMGMFNGEWLTPGGKTGPVRSFTDWGGWWFGPVALHTGKRTKTMQKIDADYERIPSTGDEDYNGMFGHSAYGSQPSPWPGWHEQLAALRAVGRGYLIEHRQEVRSLMLHFIEKGWL